MNAKHPALSPAAAGLRFRRREYGGQDARVTTTRPVYFSDGTRVMYDTTDSVTFRAVPAEHYDTDRGRTVRTGWRCIVFANGEIIYDDRGRECGKLGLAKAYLRRLADDPEMQDLALRAMGGEGVWKRTRTMHEAFMAALDDHYGTLDTASDAL